MSEINPVYSALQAYSLQFGNKNADWLENPQIKEIPFDSINKEFLNQQSDESLKTAHHALVRLKTVASIDELPILQRVIDRIGTVYAERNEVPTARATQVSVPQETPDERVERRLAHAPYLAALQGLELQEDTSRLEVAAETFEEEEPFILSTLSHSDYIDGIPLSTQERVNWAHQNAKENGCYLNANLEESIRRGAQTMKSGGFKLLIEMLMTPSPTFTVIDNYKQ
ncbi:MAG: hypothetical protein KDK76_05485, partial [Chlamydiia bacterium]|nr:hypothetical protein [Chlamydiia bacterium]